MQESLLHSQAYRKFIPIVFSSLCLSACMVGPNFHSPKAPEVSSYTETALPKKTATTAGGGKAGQAQQFITGQNIPADWWELFHSSAINQLVTMGMANSPSLAAAEATLRQAQENLNAQIGNTMFPALNLTPSAQRQRLAGAAYGGGVPSSLFNLYNASVSVSYSPDVFGGARRQIESMQAQVDYQQFQLIATYLSLTSNIVTTAVTVASLEGQIEATQSLIAEQEKQLDIMRQQFNVGGISETNVLTQQTLVEQTRATLPPLQKSLSQQLHALAVLVGKYPNEPLPKVKLESLTLPGKLPVSLPSRLVRQRPDVRAAEATFHSACAQVGVATANLFPQFPITGSYGWMALAPSGLFVPNSNAWTITAQLTQPLFHGGALQASKRAAVAAYEEAGAQYKQTLLQAFQNVADSLRAVETDARTYRAQKAAEQSAYKTLKLTQDQYVLGGVSYLNLLSAQTQYQQTKVSSIQAAAARYADTAALFQALGGGWWNRTAACGKDPVNPTRASIGCT